MESWGTLPLHPFEFMAEASLREDLLALTKARLSFLVLVTTFFGFWFSSRTQGFEGWLLAHTLVGAAAVALGSSVFNQLMEIEADRKMRRTADRPLPANRIPIPGAFVLGAVLSAFGIVHLASKVNFEAATLTALTLFVYVFLYTPLKRRSSLNTLVGAIAGAIPPVIGWVAAFGPNPGEGGFRRETVLSLPALFLFALLFLWQLPHFLAINWMYREQYEAGGFVMWSNGDETGARTSLLAVLFTLPLIPLMGLLWVSGDARIWCLVMGALCGLVMLCPALRFRRERSRATARNLFLSTLVYLPVLLGLLLCGWRGNPS